MTCPTFSIITPSYNQGRFIERTIESVRTQSHPAMEHLVFDGGSTDGTVDILRKYGDAITWESEPDRGQAHAVNKGLARAKGDIIGWINSDDVYCPGAFERVADHFAAHPEALVVYGEGPSIDEDDNVLGFDRTRPYDYDAMARMNIVSQPALFMRREVVERFGLLDERLRFCMDYDYWLRIGREVHFHYLPVPLAYERMHEQCKTLQSKLAAAEEILETVWRHCGRVSEELIYHSGYMAAEQLGLDRTKSVQNLLILAYARVRMHVYRERFNGKIDVKALLSDVALISRTLACIPWLFVRSRLKGLPKRTRTRRGTGAGGDS